MIIFIDDSGGGGGGFTYAPALILDPSDLSTLFQDSAGTTPVAADGDPVGRWNDKSGNGHDFIQATSGSRPAYRVSGGVHWIDFTLGQFLYAETAGSVSFASVALFIGYRAVSGVNDYGAIIGVPHANSHVAPFWRWELGVRTSGFDFAYTTNGGQWLNNDANAAAVGNDVLMTIGYSSMWRQPELAMKSQLIRINKAEWYPGNSGVATQSYPNSTPAYIGAHLGTTDGRFQGRIYGILLADTAVTSQAWIDEWEGWVDARTP